MHEEDGEEGLWAESPSGERWQSFGDGRLPDKSPSAASTSTALVQCQKALQQSVKEVHDAFSSKELIGEAQFGAWYHAPILQTISAQSENHKPLLDIKGNTIRYRSGGLQSTSYKTIEQQIDWIAFYRENYSRIDAQVRLWLKQNVPFLASIIS